MCSHEAMFICRLSDIIDGQSVNVAEVITQKVSTFIHLMSTNYM